MYMNNGHIIVNAESANDNLNQKISKINTNDEFDDKSLIVILKPSKSKYHGIDCEFIEKLNGIEEVKSYYDLSELSFESLNNEGIDTKSYSSIKNHLDSIDFKQILKINLTTTSKQEVVEIIKQIETFEEVFSVVPNYAHKSNDVIVDDTYFENQWALTGTNGINITEAWNFTTGSNNIRVGIIDSGIANHLDLNDNVVAGMDFYNNNTITTDDVGGHGTSVAGIISAAANNAIGIAGINHNISLVPLQTAYDTSGSGNHYTTDIIEAIVYARDLWENPEKRIHIINYSITGFGYNSAVLSAVESFKGLFVWAAGNDGENLDLITDIENFSLDNLISVGAHDENGQRSIWNSTKSSSYGQIVDIYAPSVCYTTYSITNNSYRTFGGTSCATPHVTGVAALLLSLDDNLNARQLKQAILQSSDNIVITIPDGSNQNVKKLNANNSVKYVLTNYSEINDLNFDAMCLNKDIDERSSIFNKKNYFMKLNVHNDYGFDFFIYSSDAIGVTLLSSSFNEVNISVTSSQDGKQIEFEHYLPENTYYLKINFITESSLGTINVNINCKHSHSVRTWMYYDRISHRGRCSCGEIFEKTHVVNVSDVINHQAECLECHIMLDLRYDIITNRVNNRKESINGSFILPNGIIVLVGEDIEAYFNGTLIFYNNYENTVTQ